MGAEFFMGVFVGVVLMLGLLVFCVMAGAAILNERAERGGGK